LLASRCASAVGACSIRQSSSLVRVQVTRVRKHGRRVASEGTQRVQVMKERRGSYDSARCKAHNDFSPVSYRPLYHHFICHALSIPVHATSPPAGLTGAYFLTRRLFLCALHFAYYFVGTATKDIDQKVLSPSSKDFRSRATCCSHAIGMEDILKSALGSEKSDQTFMLALSS